MRIANSIVLCALAVAGCGPEFAVVPQNGMERAVAQQSGVTMVAFANQWNGDPYDLADYVTPIAVELYNGSPYEVRVNLADLALRDASGFRYAAVNPYLQGAMSVDEPRGDEPRVTATLVAANGPILLASSHGGGGGGHFSGGGHFGGGRVMSAPAGGRSYGPSGGRVIGPPSGGRFYGAPVPGRRYGWGFGGGGWNGYLVAGGLRPWFGFGIGYWGGPWFYPPYYYDWVFAWGPAYYPTHPSMDVLTLGLPEGVLPPGARVCGFLYFRRATGEHQGTLDLSWEAHDARTGAPLGTLHVPLEVVHR
jgi:hypothetical protein